MSLKFRKLPHQRIGQLKASLAAKNGLRIIEAHDGLSGLLGATTFVQDGTDNAVEFDGLWISSLTDSAAKGHPDAEIIDASSRLQTIQEILNVTHKPLIVDGDTGGDPTQFEYFCSKLESLGVSAVVIEDKKYPKRNSLDNDSLQILEDPYVFASKINRGKAVCLSPDFMIFARIESFIANLGLEDALTRAAIYLDSQADGLLIHSKSSNADQIMAFMTGYKQLCQQKNKIKPIICVPTTYYQITDLQLFAQGIHIVIYANQPLRAAYQAMQDVCKSILTHGRSLEITNRLASVDEIMGIVGFNEVKEKDKAFQYGPNAIAPTGLTQNAEIE